VVAVPAMGVGTMKQQLPPPQAATGKPNNQPDTLWDFYTDTKQLASKPTVKIEDKDFDFFASMDSPPPQPKQSVTP